MLTKNTAKRAEVLKLTLPGLEKYVDVNDQAKDRREVTILPEMTMNFKLLSRVLTKFETLPSSLLVATRDRP